MRGGRPVFSGLSFEVGTGEALLLTGANGSGKSSLLRLVAGLLRPAAGSLALTGGDADAPLAERVHYVGHLDAVKPALTVRETLAFWAALFGGKEEEIEAGLERFALGPLAALPAGYLSAGQKRRLSLARLGLGRRPVWLLDEPTVSLDAENERVLIDAIQAHLASGGLTLVATHTALPLAGARELRLGNGAAA